MLKPQHTRWLSRSWLLPLILGMVLLVSPLPGSHSQPVERYFRIQANRFAYSPSILKVNPGDRVTLELVSSDVMHGLSVDDYDLTITAEPGQTGTLTFVADRSGTFRFRCSVTCGSLHPFMIGKLQVGGNYLWWRAAGLSILAVSAVLLRRLS
jgi:plastocyanin